jgi:tetratricopeptide repeat protein 30|uniref:Tetratricopeptide repeat protein 30 n=1 Tax=Eutreptiella gymnastica TaxID=73025 RepID=A0A7S4G7V6_9EUGL|mmetsp:Transcript_73449/g.123787  ORF Transcript_73449/g.123787 Transcript_73449/m.123787 type:complete len:669 (-) Transcript_73449:1105-3111(-)
MQPTMQTMRPMTMMGGGTTLGARPPLAAAGNYTQTVYTFIKEGKFEEVTRILSHELENFPRSRAALSLLGYAYYQLGDFAGASTMYEQLTKICPDVEEYKIYYGQALYKSGSYPEALKVLSAVNGEEHHQRIQKLLASIKYEQDDLTGTKSHLDKCLQDDPDVVVLTGCVQFKEGRYEDASNKYVEAMNALGFQADLAYNIALCHYKTKHYGPCLKHIAEIIERGIREHPELSIGSNTEGIEVRSVGNSQVLKETALVEAFNLKSAIEYMMKNMQAAKEALSDMPPRSDDELDPVTLHNTALMNMEDDPTSGFKKLNFLLQNPPFPPETFQNLLILYIKYQYYDLAADVLADNSHLSFQYLSQDLYDFLDGCITCQTSPEEAYRKFDILSQKHIDHLRKLTKHIQDKKNEQDTDAVKKALRDYDEALELYIPVLMAQAKIYWDLDHYAMVEKIFRQSAEFTSEHDIWKLNVAHTFFMSETKFKEAMRYYEPAVEKFQDNILSCSAIVLANLCVSYIMTSENEKAEDVMRRIEKEEERLSFSDPEKQPLHLCIVNLVIGTLYCAKGNFEFGISRIIKSLEPYNRKIMTDTWFYAKRCFLALAETLAKHMIMLKDITYQEILAFFDAADVHGKTIPAVIHMDPSKQDHSETNTVRHEARLLKKLFLKLRE